MRTCAVDGGDSNGVTWITDCLLEGAKLKAASARLGSECKGGIRHFSALRCVVPLEQAESMEAKIFRIERELEREVELGW